MTIETVREMGPRLGIAPTCTALGLPTATYYRRIGPKPPCERRPSPPRKLAASERSAVLEVLQRARVRRSGSGASLRAASRCRALPLLGADDVPDPGGESRGAGAARSAAPPVVCGSRAPGHRSESGLELGYHQAARAGEVVRLLSLRDPASVHPLRLGLDGRAPRKRGAGEEADRADLPAPGDRPGRTHAPCRPWTIDDVEAGGVAALGPRGHRDPFAAPRVQPQPPVLSQAQRDESH